MLTKKMESALNTQINEEFWAAYLYLSMSAYFTSEGFPGFAGWMHVQAQEEVTHAMKIYNYVLERGGKVALEPLKAVATSWKSPLDVFQASLEHEQKVTAMIDKLVEIAIEEKDHATRSMLQWFIDEQVEEESSAKTIIDSLKLIGDNGYGLYSIDKDLASRTFVDETKES
ncbi:MAG: ferritin [Prevotellaceae bacterium]|jgi:ferritin|nr:ferritin [Prevotellaceae bacterium]